MKKKNYMSWETYFMSIAILSSFRSKDPKTQTGACIVDSDNKIIGIGYNGLPRGVSDLEKGVWDDDKNILNSKHTYVVHAEKNAIYNCMKNDMSNSTLYVTLRPCNVCAQAIIQVGIKKVVFLEQKNHHSDYNKAVDKMFKAAKIEIVKFSDLKIEDKKFIETLMISKKIYD